MLIKFTVDRFEEAKAVLIANDGTSIIWPKDKLPGDIHEGSAVSFNILEAVEWEKRDKQAAKDIINEIIKNS